METQTAITKRRERAKKIKNTILWVLPTLIVIGGLVWLLTLPKKDFGDVISQHGIHIHPQLSITIDGENVKVPGGIGLIGVQRDIHTHEPDGVLHIEKNGTVYTKDATVGNFFAIWGKEFSETNILGNKTGEGGTVKMFVNGVPNNEFENYQMRDGDRIEIVFE